MMNPDLGQFSALQDIGKHTSEGLFIVHEESKKIVYINARAADMIQLGMDASMDNVILRVIPEDREYVEDQYAKFIEHSYSSEIEFSISKDGKIIPVCCNAFAIEDKKYVVAFIKDISTAKQSENYIIEFGTRKNTLLDTVVHNFSGALLLMQHLSAEAAKASTIADESNLKVYLDLLNQNSRHCIDIINKLLQDERAQAPGIAIKTSRMEMVEKVKIIFDNLVNTYQHRKFSFHSSANRIYGNADEFKVLLIINNLISNAIKFTPDDQEISMTVRKQDREVVISVIDHGIGIPTSLQPFLFERHSIAGRQGLKGEKSLGLGLFVSKQLIEGMKGSIRYESSENNGSAFHVILPTA